MDLFKDSERRLQHLIPVSIIGLKLPGRKGIGWAVNMGPNRRLEILTLICTLYRLESPESSSESSIKIWWLCRLRKSACSRRVRSEEVHSVLNSVRAQTIVVSFQPLGCFEGSSRQYARQKDARYSRCDLPSNWSATPALVLYSKSKEGEYYLGANEGRSKGDVSISA